MGLNNSPSDKFSFIEEVINIGFILLSFGLSLKSPILMILATGLIRRMESIIFLFNNPAEILFFSLFICPPALDGQ